MDASLLSEVYKRYEQVLNSEAMIRCLQGLKIFLVLYGFGLQSRKTSGFNKRAHEFSIRKKN